MPLSVAQLCDRVPSREPADDQDLLREAAQGVTAAAGAAPQPLGVQQAGHVPHGLFAHAERGGVCDDSWSTQDRHEVDLGRTTYISGFCVVSLHRDARVSCAHSGHRSSRSERYAKAHCLKIVVMPRRRVAAANAD
jgi:hypothetical protein